MKKYYAGETVTRGVYLNTSTWELLQHYNGNPILPGDAGVAYIKVPAVLAVIGGPFAGLAFVIFLPFVGIVGLVSFLAYKMGWLGLLLGRKAVQPVMIAWRPGRAYLTRKGGTPAARKPEGAPDEDLPNMSVNDIANEITRRRQNGEK
jgi:hypothetical protein